MIIKGSLLSLKNHPPCLSLTQKKKKGSVTFDKSKVQGHGYKRLELKGALFAPRTHWYTITKGVCPRTTK